MDGKRDMLDLFSVPDVFVTGMGHAEELSGGNWRFTFFTEQDIHGARELVVTAKIIMSKEAVPEAIRIAARSTKTCACENARLMARN